MYFPIVLYKSMNYYEIKIVIIAIVIYKSMNYYEIKTVMIVIVIMMTIIMDFKCHSPDFLIKIERSSANFCLKFKLMNALHFLSDVFRGYGLELIRSNLLINLKQNLGTIAKSQHPLRGPVRTKYLFKMFYFKHLYRFHHLN